MLAPEKAAAVERARKLLRLAESPNPHEAANAKERAQALIDRYQLSPEDISGDVLEIVDEKSDDYKGELGRIIGIACGCGALTSAKGAMAFRGKRQATKTAASVYAALLAELGRCPTPSMPSMPERETWFACFRLGFIAAIANRLLLKQRMPVQSTPGTGGEKTIVPIAKNVIEALDYLASMAEEPEPLFTVRIDAYTAGQTAGYRVDLPMIEPHTIALPEGSK